ncbi:hypothetical protein [Dyadobacter sp. 3J3]|uniref:hypothetical protein n=1 Tax=Dyadobacter sp. 3J3 TaxID=2606600 RepID=UPI00135C78F3|nr:hypothetical protein [Dyadobacter sp. 3J3]
MPTAFGSWRERGCFPGNEFPRYNVDHAYGIWILAGKGLFSPGMNSRVTMSAVPTAFGFGGKWAVFPGNEFPRYNVGRAYGIWILAGKGLFSRE